MPGPTPLAKLRVSFVHPPDDNEINPCQRLGSRTRARRCPPPHRPSNNLLSVLTREALMPVLSLQAARPHIRWIPPIQKAAGLSEQFAFLATSSPEPEGLRYAAEF